LFYGFLHQYDFYAIPISLTFNKKGSFQTVLGGICSIMTTILVLVYFAAKIDAFADLNFTLSSQISYL